MANGSPPSDDVDAVMPGAKDLQILRKCLSSHQAVGLPPRQHRSSAFLTGIEWALPLAVPGSYDNGGRSSTDIVKRSNLLT